MLETLERVPNTSSGNAKLRSLAVAPTSSGLALRACADNVYTALPYIDVVNEIMEVRLAEATWPNWPSTPNPIENRADGRGARRAAGGLYPTDFIAAYTALNAMFISSRRRFTSAGGGARLPRPSGCPTMFCSEVRTGWTGPNPRHVALEQSCARAGGEFDIIALSATPAQVYPYWGIASGNWPADLNLAKNLMEKGALTFDELQAVGHQVLQRQRHRLPPGRHVRPGNVGRQLRADRGPTPRCTACCACATPLGSASATPTAPTRWPGRWTRPPCRGSPRSRRSQANSTRRLPLRWPYADVDCWNKWEPVALRAHLPGQEGHRAGNRSPSDRVQHRRGRDHDHRRRVRRARCCAGPERRRRAPAHRRHHGQQ